MRDWRVEMLDELRGLEIRTREAKQDSNPHPEELSD